jgi:exosome complex component RRP42
MEYTDMITKQRIKQYLEQGKRFDGRGLNDFRELVIEKNVSKNAEGSVKIKLGKTEVIVGVKMEVGTPYPDSPNKGNLMVTSEFLPLSSPRIELGPPQFPSIELGRVVDRGIRESHFIDFEKLCIKEGEKVWTVMVDIYTINDDGNLFDAAAIGAVVALLESKIPFYDLDKGKIDYSKESKEKLPLSEGIPLSLTAYIIDEKVILDPTLEEEDLICGRVTLGIRNGIICSMQKGFECEINIELLGNIFDLLENKIKIISDLIQEKLK